MTKPKMFVIDPHPAIPPSDLLKKWEDMWFAEEEHADVLLIQAFQAGADEELEACVEWISKHCATWTNGKRPEDELRAARRPKPETKSPTDEELCEHYKKAYYESVDRQGPGAQVYALRAVLERWGK